MRLSEKITNGATIADRILLILLIIISASGFIFIKKAFPQGTDVIIDVNGSTEYKLPLKTNAVVRVKGMMGDTVVEIKDRKVCIKESPCPNKICIHNGWIDIGTVVCLPNRVTVTIINPEGRKDKGIDAIAG